MPVLGCWVVTAAFSRPRRAFLGECVGVGEVAGVGRVVDFGGERRGAVGGAGGWRVMARPGEGGGWRELEVLFVLEVGWEEDGEVVGDAGGVDVLDCGDVAESQVG